MCNTLTRRGSADSCAVLLCLMQTDSGWRNDWTQWDVDWTAGRLRTWRRWWTEFWIWWQDKRSPFGFLWSRFKLKGFSKSKSNKHRHDVHVRSTWGTAVLEPQMDESGLQIRIKMFSMSLHIISLRTKNVPNCDVNIRGRTSTDDCEPHSVITATMFNTRLWTLNELANSS